MEHGGLELWVWCLEYGSGHGQLRTRVERVKLFLSLGLLALSLKANTGVHGPKGSSLEFPAETVASPMDGLTHKLIKVISGEVEQKAQCLLPLSVSRVSIEKWVAQVAPLWVALNGCSCPNLLFPISPTATLCHGVGKCGSADSDSYTAIFHATPATAASKGKTSCPKQAKSLKPKIFCHCLWWLKRGAGILGLDRRKGIGVVLAMRLPAAGPTPPPLPFDLRICHKWGLGPSAHLQGQGCKSEMEVVKGTAL
uniref:HDC06615 n=1 Tax=Drosophila melanogaster TaxID=7227 RepID=Q6IGC9_DROME|nr:TPA_inf: HDC06615 [Drosophila melanogaster]